MALFGRVLFLGSFVLSCPTIAQTDASALRDWASLATLGFSLQSAMLAAGIEDCRRLAPLGSGLEEAYSKTKIDHAALFARIEATPDYQAQVRLQRERAVNEPVNELKEYCADLPKDISDLAERANDFECVTQLMDRRETSGPLPKICDGLMARTRSIRK